MIQSYLYAVEPTDPVTYGAVAVTFVLLGVLACLIPARRALRVDPVRALQAE
jgi:ABC-type lipoprotein release transport system permease subunit